MAVIHLEFDVDDDVYPELHAALAFIGSSMARGERLRQLAATGLVWEKCRAQGEYLHPSSPLDSVGAVIPAGAAAAATSIPAPAPLQAAIQHAAAAAAAMAATPPGRKPNAAPADFVDLAINAVPASSWADLASPYDDEVTTTPGELPLLSDEVFPDENDPLLRPPLPAVQPRPRPRPPDPVLPSSVPAVSFQSPRPAALAADEPKPRDEEISDVATEPDGLPLMAITHNSNTARPRLRRMKERGLFKNG